MTRRKMKKEWESGERMRQKKIGEEKMQNAKRKGKQRQWIKKIYKERDEDANKRNEK